MSYRPMATLEGLIFDLDGTLTLTQQLHQQAFGEVFARFGVTYTPEDDMTRYAGLPGSQIFPLVFAEHGVAFDDAMIAHCRDEKKRIYDELLARAEIVPTPGVVRFLEAMRERGIPMIVASGNRLDAITSILERAGLSTFFVHVLTSDHGMRPKPAPDMFLAAAEHLHADPHHCVVFEDSLNGVRAAATGHIPCIGVATMLPKLQLESTGAALAITDYAELSYDVLTSLI